MKAFFPFLLDSHPPFDIRILIFDIFGSTLSFQKCIQGSQIIDVIYPGS